MATRKSTSKRWWVTIFGQSGHSVGPFLKKSTAREKAQAISDKTGKTVEYQQIDADGTKIGYPSNTLPKTRRNPRSVSLSNFCGTISRKPNGAVIIRGTGKMGRRKR